MYYNFTGLLINAYLLVTTNYFENLVQINLLLLSTQLKYEFCIIEILISGTVQNGEKNILTQINI